VINLTDEEQTKRTTKVFRICILVAIGILALMVMLVNVRVTQINTALYVVNDNINNANDNVIESNERLENDHFILREFINKTCGEEI